MQLRHYLETHQISVSQFAGRVQVSMQALYRYMDKTRVPRREVMERIRKETEGKVTPNDFFAHDPEEAA